MKNAKNLALTKHTIQAVASSQPRAFEPPKAVTKRSSGKSWSLSGAILLSCMIIIDTDSRVCARRSRELLKLCNSSVTSQVKCVSKEVAEIFMP